MNAKERFDKKTIQELVELQNNDLDYAKSQTRVVMYCRTSMKSQKLDLQYKDLLEVAKRMNWRIVRIYEEQVSGTKGVEDRTALKQLLFDASKKRFDKVMIWDVSRLARNMRHLISVCEQLKDYDINIYAYNQNLDTSTMSGQAFFQMCGIFSEMETELRAERQKLGIARALERGAKFGRKSKLTNGKLREIRRLRERGLSFKKISNEVELGVATIHKVVKNMRSEKVA
jgi:DNA invertase Pin-like site-specific DNA recombinase